MSDAFEDTIREELEKAASLITRARLLMAEGRHVDLSAMEERMRTITAAVEAAPPAVAAGFKEHLGALMEALDTLEQDLQAYHAALEEGLSAIQSRTAHDAYGPKKK